MGNGTSIGKVRGLGSSHSGSHHWLLQRFTAVGNLLLILWLIASLLMLHDFAYETLTQGWLARPLPAAAMSLLVISTFWHTRLGMQVLIEDYVHTPGNKFSAMVLLNFAAFGGAAIGVLFVARIVMASLGQHVAEEVTAAALKSAMGGR